MAFSSKIGYANQACRNFISCKGSTFETLASRPTNNDQLQTQELYSLQHQEIAKRKQIDAMNMARKVPVGNVRPPAQQQKRQAPMQQQSMQEEMEVESESDGYESPEEYERKPTKKKQEKEIKQDFSVKPQQGILKRKAQQEQQQEEEPQRIKPTKKVKGNTKVVSQS